MIQLYKNLDFFFKKNNKIICYILLFTAIVTSSISKINRSSNHFQEVDSYITFRAIQDYPNFAFEINKQLFPDSNAIINKIRIPIIKSIAASNLPFCIKSFFALPQSTTYSPLPGLLYGLTSYQGQKWVAFKKNAIKINVFFFDIAILLLFFSLLKLSANHLASLFSVSILIYSYSFYHYSFHFGSTVFIFFSLCTFLFSIIYLRKKILCLYLVCSILIFFNYLIFIYILPIIIYHFINTSLNIKKLHIYFMQSFIFFIPTLLLILFFLRPNSSYKGGFRSVTQIPKNFFYLFNNIFSCSNKISIENITLFVILFLITIVGLFNFPKFKKFAHYYVFIFLTLSIFFCVKILDFTPDRQQLHLFTVFVIPICFGIKKIILYFNNIQKFIILLSIISFNYSCFMKSHKKTDRIALESLQLNTKVVVNKNEPDIIQQIDEKRIITVDKLERDSSYIYLSNFMPIEKNQNLNKINFNILHNTKIENFTYFTAFNKFNSDFTRPNNLYFTIFKLN